MGSGKPWSTLNLNNLREGLRAGMPIPKLASFLIREVDEVEAKIAELAASRTAEQQAPDRRKRRPKFDPRRSRAARTLALDVRRGAARLR